jgi:nicotinic acid mononucleotide adenylyltransferase
MYPDDTIRFIFGADKLHYRWIQKEALITSFEFIIIPRDDINTNAIVQSSSTLSKFSHRIHMVEYHEEISSTKVRDQLYHTGYSNLVTPAVLKYIRMNKCYPLQDYLFCPECHRPITDGKCFNPTCVLGYPIDMFYQNNIKDH